MRIFVVADHASAMALRDALSTRNPCATGWKIVTEPHLIIEDLTRGLNHPEPISEGRWMVVCRDDI